SATTVRNTTAPMPGLITSVRVSIGDTIVAGTPLLVLEAMKMENVLQSPGEGTVTQVRVKPGDRVEKGQVLVEF
ncbi:MAG: acetyl-CoA carboxylase biotin carboxyl carrier protein subunit, partial [Bacteroidota bacterium]